MLIKCHNFKTCATILIGAISLFYSSYSFAQQKPKLFHDGDRICFVGNSITHNGEFHNLISLFYATRFPNERLTFFNCGISGDRASGVLGRMDDDILSHRPNKVALMIGMNDVNRSLYTEKNRNNPQVEKAKSDALNLYREKTEEILKIFKKNNLDIIIQKPTIYDQSAKTTTENLYGVNDALHIAGDHMALMSKKYNTRLVDYWTIMNRINNELQAKDSTATITSLDRVHPGSPGHFVMAYQFLSTLEPNKYVAKIVIGKNLNKSKAQSINCSITDLKHDNGQLTFRCLEYSLPFPVTDAAQSTLAWVPFINDLDQELLKADVSGNGKFELLIDGITVGLYTADELRNGINLSQNQKTPQYQQALKVMGIVQRIRTAQVRLRYNKLVEINDLKDAPANMSIDQIDAYLKKRLEEKFKGSDYHQKYFNNYVKDKPQQAAIEQEIENLQDSVYTENHPKEHSYLIKPVK
ncbi:SGNH/GDSL hydrolase family protein [Flavobacterium daemonense]|uniref:SGNH/GDSL hydrolase family protein n=1 Tax=Flavobacterium daemonense TaxID=1393049 RepID=UPI0011864433|nr:SGNH/GDSL hydrolase family protein [Flavobacterium daemonense]KAF2330618.1 SGNH/GDSL hydrolase family protein [Flavobacterium daemonense]